MLIVTLYSHDITLSMVACLARRSGNCINGSGRTRLGCAAQQLGRLAHRRMTVAIGSAARLKTQTKAAMELEVQRVRWRVFADMSTLC